MVERVPPGNFEEMYQGTPPWDIGRPQPEFVRLATGGEIRGKVLDVGCGTGENALFFASEGLEVWGIDASPTAISKARSKASQRRLAVEFQVGDALRLEGLRHAFDVVIDSGLFHVFDDEQRPRFAAAMASALRDGGTYRMMCFSEHEPDWGGPRRVTQKEIRETFREGWRVDSIHPARFETNLEGKGASAWLSSITRVP